MKIFHQKNGLETIFNVQKCACKGVLLGFSTHMEDINNIFLNALFYAHSCIMQESKAKIDYKNFTFRSLIFRYEFSNNKIS
jgi:hypothetical protein